MSKDKMSEELREFIETEAKSAGYQIVDIISGKGATFIEVVLDKEEGITLDECGHFNSKIISWLDDNKLFGGNCTIDVCSPGLDRELKSENEFKWAVNKQVEVKLRESINEKNIITGNLLEKDGFGAINIKGDSGKKVCIAGKNIVNVKLKVEI